jgi:hypothetical protein
MGFNLTISTATQQSRSAGCAEETEELLLANPPEERPDAGEETAEELNVSAAPVNSRIFRAKRYLRRELAKYRSSTRDDV